MSDSVSAFQAEVSAVLQLLLKVAVMEITKVFERRTRVPCAAGGGAELCEEELEALHDLRTCLGGALPGGRAERAVCSVGVQAGEESPPELELDLDLHLEPRDKSSQWEGSQPGLQDPRVGDGLPPTETPYLDLLDTVDVQCTVDLPCEIFQEKVKEERGDDVALQTVWLGPPQTELTSEETGLQTASLLHDSSPDRFSSDVPSADLSADLSQLCLVLKEDDCVQAVTELPKVELCEAAVGSHGHAAPPSPAETASLQFIRTPFDRKLLQPCSVRLVNLLQVSDARKRPTAASCGKGASTPKDLRAHQHVHTGHRLCCFTRCGDGVWRLQPHRHSHVCKICGKKFKRRKILRRHERFHTGEKPYSCPCCHKTFALRKSLRRHERFHTGQRPHTCALCGKSFRLKDSLKAHLRFHTGEKPFTCSLCPKRFTIQKNLHKHSAVHAAPGGLRSAPRPNRQ